MRKITLVGDSVLHRTVRDEPLLGALQIRESFLNHDIINLAQGGSNSSDALEAIEGYDFSDSNLVVISLGLNDAAPWKQIPLEDFILNYEKIIKHIGHTRIALITPNAVNVNKQASPGRDNAILKMYSERITHLANRLKLRVIDMFHLSQEALEDIYVDDGVHFNHLGYAILFKELRKHIN